MEFNGFTDKANDALNCALTCAMSMGHTYVGSEHILYGLCGSNGGVAYTVLRQSGVTCNSIASRINALIGKGLPTQLTVSDFTPRSRRILESAVMIARNAGKTAAGTDHILRAIMRDNECYASVFLHEMGISGEAVLDQGADTQKNTPTLGGTESFRVLTFRMGSTRSRLNPTTRQWEDYGTAWVGVKAFRALAVNVKQTVL